MATKSKQSTKHSDESANVVRIKAADTKPAKKVSEADAKAKKSAAQSSDSEYSSRNPLVAIAGYFKGSWYELRQVRWPDRKSTWSLTGAVLLFTAFFIVVILLLDALFKYVFQLILG